MSSIYTNCKSCGCSILQRTFDRNHGNCVHCAWKVEVRKRDREFRARQRKLVPIREEDWLRMNPHGSVADEASAVGKCMSLLNAGPQQVMFDMTEITATRSLRPEDLEQVAFHLQSHLTMATDETICDFVSKNRKSYPTAPVLLSPNEFVLISSAKLSQIFADDDGWERFRETYPHSVGIAMISRVGFNFDATQALICGGQQVDYLAGHGTYWLLKKVNGQWQEVESKLAWMI